MRFPIVGDLVDYIIGDQAAQENADNQAKLEQEYRSLRAPSFSQEKYDPNMTYLPNDIQYNTVKEDPMLRQKQIENLNNMQSLANGKISAQRDLDRYKSVQDANSMAKARDDASLQQAQARGVGGGGLEFIMRQQGGQDAANRSQQADLSSAAQAALERLQASGQLQNGLSNLRNQDYSNNANNTNIINKFNELNSVRNQEALDKRAMLKNDAQQYNMNRDDRNTMAYNQAKNNIAYKTLDFLNPSQQQQLQMKYQPMYRLNDAWSNSMGNMAASAMGGSAGGDIGGSMGGGGGNGMWSNMGSMIGSKAATSSKNDDDMMNWGLE